MKPPHETWTIRTETPKDHTAIGDITKAAFRLAEHSSGTEAAIIDTLGRTGALSLSLVASIDDEIVGHVAFSPVAIDPVRTGWFGLGPIAVRPDWQKRGIGNALTREGLARLSRAGAKGCVVRGAPDYYRRFGFETDSMLRFPGAPAEFFLKLAFDGTTPSGPVTYHCAFYAV